ncbi:TonB-dependent receptor [bacterium]|nr:TonB-dependent receptor [bacterium]
MFTSTCRRLLLLLAVAVFVPVQLFAGTNGKITGMVKDKETGDALPGVNIILEGTTMGAATNAQGEFSIINVPAGVYTVSTSMIGYTKVTKQNVRVLPDFTTRLDFDLSATELGGEEVVIVAERPLIQKDQTMTMTVTSSEEIKNLPVRGFQAAANLGVGITIQSNVRNLDGGTGNVSVRGGRPNETGVYMDGFQQNNLLTGIANATVPNGAVEEVLVITGGFDAEYGRNQSGIIQVTTKSGGTRYSGNVEWNGDPGGLGVAESYGYNVFSGGIGGPIIPGNNKIRFYVSAEGRNIKDAEPSITGHPVFELSDVGLVNEQAGAMDTVLWDVNSNGKIKFKQGARPSRGAGIGMNSDRGYNLQGKLTFDVIANRLRVDLSGNYSQTYRRSFTMARVLNPDQQLLRDINNLNVGGIATYTINDRSFLDFGVNGYVSKRRLMNDRFKWSGLELYSNAQTGNTGSSSFYGDNLLNDIGRGALNYRSDEDKYLAFKSNYTNQINKNHQIKAGVDYFYHWVRLLNILDVDNPIGGSNDNIGYIVNSNYKPVKIGKDDLENKILGPANPTSFSAYLQDKLEYEGLVIRGGLRYDLFDPGAKRLKDQSDPTGQYDANQAGKFTDKNGINGYQANTTDRLWAGNLGPEDYESAEVDHKISPRFSVSFPVSEKTQFRLSYGKFFQQPNLQNLYVSPDFLERQSLAPPFATTVGNPNLKAEKSTQYEVGVRRALSDNVAIDVNAYYKDIQDLINSRAISSRPNGLIMSGNTDEGVIQGVNIAFEVRRVSKFSGRLNYTFQSARGTGSGENSGFRASWLGYSDAKFNAPLNFDQTHNINATLDIRNSKGEGPELGGQKVLENAGINFLVNAGSGLPFTPTEVVPVQVFGVPQGKVVGRRNSQRQPWTFRIDMKADKTVYFGSNMSMNVYVQVLNLLDRKNILTVYTATGLADDNGFLDSPGGQNLNQRQLLEYQVNFRDGLSYDTPRQARLGVIFNF